MTYDLLIETLNRIQLKSSLVLHSLLLLVWYVTFPCSNVIVIRTFGGLVQTFLATRGWSC